MRAALLLLLLPACEVGPSVLVTSPAAGTTIEGHDPVTIGATITGDHLVSATLRYEDVVVADTVLPRDCSAGCDVQIPWDAIAAHEGPQTLTVEAVTDDNLRGDDDVVLDFEDAPVTALIAPGADSAGYATVTVEASVTDRSQVSGTLEIDGVMRGGASTVGDCRTGCTVVAPWDTTGDLPGNHQIALVLDDGHGHGARLETATTIDDIAYATAIEVTNESDFGLLDMEIHLYDADTGAHLGCSGQYQGMEGVDASDISYPLLAWFIDDTGNILPMSALTGRNLDVEVWEDDFDPCPTAAGDPDDLVGASGPVGPITSTPQTFGAVVDLELAVGRPL